MKTHEIYTDGAYSWALDVGGWAYAIFKDNETITYYEATKETTNNRMEIIPVIESIIKVKEEATKEDIINIYSDSQYVVNTINVWLKNWISKRITHEKKNMDLWFKFLEITKGYNIKATWVRGHSGNTKNELVDELAVKAIIDYLQKNKVDYKPTDIFEYNKSRKKKYYSKRKKKK